MDQELKQAKSLNDVLDVVKRHYDLDKPMGLAVRVVVIAGVNKILKMINAKKHGEK